MLSLDKALWAVFEDFGIWKMVDRFVKYFFVDTKMSWIGILVLTGIMYGISFLIMCAGSAILYVADEKGVAKEAVKVYIELYNHYMGTLEHYKEIQSKVLSGNKFLETYLDELWWEALKEKKRLLLYREDHKITKYYILEYQKENGEFDPDTEDEMPVKSA